MYSRLDKKMSAVLLFIYAEWKAHHGNLKYITSESQQFFERSDQVFFIVLHAHKIFHLVISCGRNPISTSS